jgi:hypothetical protein
VDDLQTGKGRENLGILTAVPAVRFSEPNEQGVLRQKLRAEIFAIAVPEFFAADAAAERAPERQAVRQIG